MRALREEEETTFAHTHTTDERTNGAHCFFLSEVGVRTELGLGLGKKSIGKWLLGVMATTTTIVTRGREGKGVLYFDLEGRTGDVVVAPFYQQDVVATFAHQVVDLVLVAAGVLDVHLVAGSLWSVNANE